MAVNSAFTYPGIELWDPASWKNRTSCLVPLINRIYKNNIRCGLYYVSPAGEKDAAYEVDYRYPRPETISYWAGRQMRYGFCGLGGVSLVPEEYYANMDSEPEALLVLCEARRWNPNRVDDIFTYYHAYNDYAAEHRMTVLYVPVESRTEPDAYVSIILELAAVTHIKLKKLWLDVSSIYKAGETLCSVQSFTLRTKQGTAIEDPDSQVVNLGTIPCLDISGIWTNRGSLIFGLTGLDTAMSNAAYSIEAVVHSPVGREIAEGMALEHRFDDARDPELLEYWHSRGLNCEFRYCRHEQYIVFSPRDIPDGVKLPVMAVFQEVNDVDPHQAVSAFSYCYGLFDIAAQGECILLFFVLETVEDNDLLSEILREVGNTYPADASRVYLMGHSHDGGLTSHYARRHPKELAAIGTLGVFAGLVSAKEMGPHMIAVEDDDIEYMRTFDMPTVVAAGYNEKRCHFPLNADIQNMRPEHRNCLLTEQSRILSWQRRLRASRCPFQSAEQIRATAGSSDYVERMLGIPADRTECLYEDGFENYIADIRNEDGNMHLRVVGMGGMPHTITPLMCRLVWSFVRRFARDTETGDCLELY